MGRQVKHSSESVEHYTPPDIIDRVRGVYWGNIHLDPASCDLAQQIVGATKIYTEAEDGLSQKWYDYVFLNPPGGDLISKEKSKGVPKTVEELAHDLRIKRRWNTRSRPVAWWNKAIQQHMHGHMHACIFVGFSIEMLQSTQQDSVLSAGNLLCCIPSKRIKFWHKGEDGELKQGGSPTHANFIAFISDDEDMQMRFTKYFRSLGTIIKEAR